MRPVTTIRMSPDIRKRIEDAASKEGRSLMQEIEARLEASFQAAPLWDLLNYLTEQTRKQEEAARRREEALSRNPDAAATVELVLAALGPVIKGWINDSVTKTTTRAIKMLTETPAARATLERLARESERAAQGPTAGSGFLPPAEPAQTDDLAA